MKQVRLSEVVGGGYGQFWNFKGRYLVCKGSRGSKKSITTSLMLITRMMKYPLANTLVCRRYFNTNRDSTVASLKWAINRLGVEHLWKFTINPLQFTYLPSGSKILFRGLDDPQSITSITVDSGVLCWCWVEETFQLETEEAFNKLDMSIRGEVPEGYFKQIILTFNPWSANHWLKERFFDRYESGDDMDGDLLCLTTTYLQNEWLDDADLKIFNDMKKRFPKRYAIEGEGKWGISEGLVYDYKVEYMAMEELLNSNEDLEIIYGLDFGYTNDPTAVVKIVLDPVGGILYVADEIYETGLTNPDIANRLKDKGWDNEIIICDSAEPKSIQELKDNGIRRCRGAIKGKDSINHGIQLVQQYTIIINPSCKNFIEEISNYCWGTDAEGEPTNKPIDKFNHLMDAMRYALARKRKGSDISFAGNAKDYYSRWDYSWNI